MLKKIWRNSGVSTANRTRISPVAANGAKVGSLESHDSDHHERGPSPDSARGDQRRGHESLG